MNSATTINSETDNGLSREAWLAERKKGIGGSDAAAALGLSPYKTPYELWLEKRGEVPDEDLSGNQFVEWGMRLEDVIADAYAEKTGQRVHRVNRSLQHPQYEWMRANLDRRVVGVKGGLEVKTANAWVARDEELWGETGTDQVPPHYLIQTQHYMAVTGYDWFDLAALLGGNDFRIYRIHRNNDLIATMIEQELEFWNMVQNGPAPDAKTMADVKRKWPSQMSNSYIEIDDDTAPVLAEYLEIDARMAEFKALEKRKEALATVIGDYMRDNETLTVNGTNTITFKEQSTGKRLPGSFRDDEPAMFEKYAVEGRTRIMRIVGKSKGKKA